VKRKSGKSFLRGSQSSTSEGYDEASGGKKQGAGKKREKKKKDSKNTCDSQKGKI